MKLIADADKYVSGKALKPEAALRLASRLDKARAAATRTDQGLYEVARERVLVTLLRQQADAPAGTVARLTPGREGPHLAIVRPPKGRRAPAALIPVDRLPDDVRAAFAEVLSLPDADDLTEQVDGLDVRAPDPALVAALAGMTAEECIAAALAAEEEYDYDRAVSAYRLAVIRSSAELSTVRELVRFLSELYADYEEIAELLGSPRIDAPSHRDLHIHLAHAHYHLEQVEEACEAYEALLAADPADAVLQLRLGKLRLKTGDIDAALAHLERSVKLDPGSAEARRLVEKARSTRRDAAGDQLATAQAAFEAGDVAEARRICEAMRGRGVRHPGVGELLRVIDEHTTRAAASAHVQAALAAEEREDWDGAAEALAAAEAADPSHLVDRSALLERVGAARAQREYARHVSVGREREAADDLTGALLAFTRAHAAEAAGASPGQAPRSALRRRLDTYLLRNPRPAERQLDGVAALHRAAGDLEAARLNAAGERLREAARALKDDPDVLALQAQLDAAVGAERGVRAESLRAAASERSAAGDSRGALRLLDEAATLVGDDFCAEERRQLRDEISAADQLADQEQRVGALVDAERWWDARHAVASAAATSPALAELDARATAAIEAVWTLPVLRRVDVPGSLDLTALGFPDDVGKRLLTVIDPAGRYVVCAADRLLLLAELPDVASATLFELPEPLALDRAEQRIFVSGHRLVVLDCASRTLTHLAVTRTAEGPVLEVADRVTLDRTVHADRSEDGAAARLATETAFDPESGRLLTLVAGGGRTRNRLLSVDVTDGHVHNAEDFSYPVFNLRHIAGDNRFTVQRQFDMRAMGPRFYNIAVVDARTRVQERILFRQLDEPMHAVRRITRLSDGKLLCQYWYIDPFTGNVAKESSAFMELKADWGVRFQNSDPARLLGARDERGIIGAFAVHEPSGSVVFPWLRYDKDREHGLSVVSLDRFEPRWDLEMPSGQSLARLYDDPASQRVWVQLVGEGGVSLRPLDWGGRALG